MSVHVENLSKTYHSFAAVKHVSLRVNTGELVALVGPSGSGKTTLLRLIAGLEHPDPGSGCIQLHDRDVAAESVANRKSASSSSTTRCSNT